jgi:hypothetical protein
MTIGELVAILGNMSDGALEQEACARDEEGGVMRITSVTVCYTEEGVTAVSLEIV